MCLYTNGKKNQRKIGTLTFSTTEELATNLLCRIKIFLKDIIGNTVSTYIRELLSC